jgi:multidrug resistance efflux pump
MAELEKFTLNRSAGIPVPDNQDALTAGPGFSVAQGKSGGWTRISPGQLKKAALALAIVAGVFGAACYGRYYWTTGRYLVTTDDAYVAAHWVMISPRVSGYISEVLVDDNQAVKAGRVIVRLDPRDYQAALDQARDSVAAARAMIDTLTQQIDQQKLAVDQARQAVAAGQAAFTYSRQNFTRYTELAHKGFGPVQLAQQSTADIREKQAALSRDMVAVNVAQKQVDVYKAQLAQAQAEFAQQQASERQAELNLGYTEIKAPFDGTLGMRTVQVGENVQPGTQLMALVPLQAGLHLCQLHGNPADERAPWSAGHDPGRHLSGRGRARPRRKPVTRQRRGVRPAAAGQRHRQLHQDRPANPRQDRDRSERSARRPVASGNVGRADHRHQARSLIAGMLR